MVMGSIGYCIGFFAELINTVLEHIIGTIPDSYDSLKGKAKDIAAAAVLIVSLFALVVGACVFAPKVIALWNQIR